jgi:hypothetical protein
MVTESVARNHGREVETEEEIRLELYRALIGGARRSLAPQRVKIGSIRAPVIISVGGKEAPQSLTKIEAAAYGGAPSAQGSRALDRGRDAISAVGRQSIAGSSAGNRQSR